jgi:AcrR family transcriptional regulator
MPSTPRGEKTKQAFLDAAKRVFAEKGYFNAKITDISAAAGRSPGSFYNYYDNKESLLEDLAEDFINEVLGRARFVHRGDPYTSIKEVVTVYWDTYKEYVPTLIGLFHLSMTDARFAATWQQLRKHAVQNVMGGVRKAYRDGYARGIDEHAFASAIMSMLDFYCWTWLANDGEPGFGPIADDVAIETLSQVWYRTLYFPVADAPVTGAAPAARAAPTTAARSSKPTAASATTPASQSARRPGRKAARTTSA